MWEIVHLVGFYYKNISRCTVLWMSKLLRTYQATQHNMLETIMIMLIIYVRLVQNTFFMYESLINKLYRPGIEANLYSVKEKKAQVLFRYRTCCVTIFCNLNTAKSRLGRGTVVWQPVLRKLPFVYWELSASAFQTHWGGYTLVTLPRIVTPYRDSVDGTRARVTYQTLVMR